ncbi:MAG: class I SAM-dependent methyltransferase [Alphaproteobacteria bacterium]|nr:class I SAM-dependent methyltransferase [Alphaproteobacteria bacterium]
MILNLHELDDLRTGEREQARIADLMALVPAGPGSVLDVGARDGYLSRRLADRGHAVSALDLTMPDIADDRIALFQGNATRLEFPDAAFDTVLCAEVLEHIAMPGLESACAELTRVARRCLVIGVPYRQDIRLWRTTCPVCGGGNPPWGHVNSFDEGRLRSLFPGLVWDRHNFVGETAECTNALAAWLMDRAGNPWGTYQQDEPCIHCGGELQPPRVRPLASKLLSRLAQWVRQAQAPLVSAKPLWIHVRFRKPD